MGIFDLFANPKPTPVVIIRNVLGEEIDRVEGAYDLVRQDLRNRDWRHAQLSGLVLDGADLSGSNLLGAQLKKSSLSHAILRGTELSYADAEGADFRWADLSGCLMFRTETKSARFDQAIFSVDSDMPGLKVLATMRVFA